VHDASSRVVRRSTRAAASSVYAGSGAPSAGGNGTRARVARRGRSHGQLERARRR
jgi:hypothetical protein